MQLVAIRIAVAIFAIVVMCWLYAAEQLLGTMATERPKMELLNRMTSGGLSVSYSFTRTISMSASNCISIELSLTNFSDRPIADVHIGNKVGQFRWMKTVA